MPIARRARLDLLQKPPDESLFYCSPDGYCFAAKTDEIRRVYLDRFESDWRYFAAILAEKVLKNHVF